MVARIQALHQQGRPVLVGTRSVEDSEHVERCSRPPACHTGCSTPARTRTRPTDRNAGERGSVTVATNMAGRGTDIPLGPGVAALGGLHVIAVERNDSRRIDRQLIGRCARQGDPGSFESILSLEDEILTSNCPKFLKNMAANGVRDRSPIAGWKSRLLLAAGQSRSEARLRSRRRALERMEAYLGKILSFAGQQE